MTSLTLSASSQQLERGIFSDVSDPGWSKVGCLQIASAALRLPVFDPETQIAPHADYPN